MWAFLCVNYYKKNTREQKVHTFVLKVLYISELLVHDYLVKYKKAPSTGRSRGLLQTTGEL